MKGLNEERLNSYHPKIARKAEKSARNHDRANILRTAILNGLLNAKRAGYVLPFDIATEVQIAVENALDLRLKNTYRTDYDSDKYAMRAEERFKKEFPEWVVIAGRKEGK